MSEDTEKWLTIPSQLRNWDVAPRAELIERIKELEDPWISVETRMPEDERKRYLIRSESESADLGHGDHDDVAYWSKAYDGGHWLVIGSDRDDFSSVTHWFEIPELKE